MSRPIIIVADTSPLIALSTMGILNHLPSLFSIVYIPDEVGKECTNDLSKPMAKTIMEAINSGILEMEQTRDRKAIFQLKQILDEGEAAAIVLAKEKSAQILIDEKAGRQVTKREGLLCKGSMFCLIECKNKGLISSARRKIQMLRQQGYYLDNSLISTVLSKCNE